MVPAVRERAGAAISGTGSLEFGPDDAIARAGAFEAVMRAAGTW